MVVQWFALLPLQEKGSELKPVGLVHFCLVFPPCVPLPPIAIDMKIGLNDYCKLPTRIKISVNVCSSLC